MSIDTKLYLGPYAEWQVPLVEVREDRCRKLAACPNVASGFCPACGIDVKGRFVSSRHPERSPECDTLTRGNLHGTGSMGSRYEEIEEDGKLIAAFRHVPNVRRGTPRDFDLEDQGELAVDLRTLDAAAEVAWFNDAFARELAALAEAFGKGPMLRWGLLRWYN